MMIQDTIRNSRGIACCRRNADKELEILLVQKRYTHSFAAFVFGEYELNDAEYIRELIGGMTVLEKSFVSLRRYDFLHSFIWLAVPTYGDEDDAKSRVDGWKSQKRRQSGQMRRQYMKRRDKYNDVMAADGGDFIARILRKTGNGELPWEIPKGRREHGETTLNWAKREFLEETGMPPEKFEIMPGVATVHEERRSPGKTYVSKYHIAFCCDPEYEPIIRYALFSQRIELCAIKWMSKADIERVRDKRLSVTTSRIFAAAGAKYIF